MHVTRTSLALAALIAGVGLTGSAFATPALPFTVNCKTMNAANIGVTADSNGYTSIDPFPTGGVFTWGTNYNYPDVPLPANGIICVKSFIGQPSSSYTNYMRFVRNSSNTPVYILVEETMELRYSYITVDGGSATDYYSVGLTDKGGLGGPGGSDGGSCDFGVATSLRSGEGLGPGGARAANQNDVGGGGGAGPTRGGSSGYNAVGGTSAGALPGNPTSQFDDRILHGGSGGGCGNRSTIAYGGGGGGGVIVVVAGISVHLGLSPGFGIYARGGNSFSAGGGGGGGMIRVISPTIMGDGLLDVRGSASTMGTGTYTSNPSCNNTSNYGGCGGHGLVKLEGYDVAGNFLLYSTRANGAESVKFGAPQTPVLATASIPTVEVINVAADFDGTTENQQPPPVDFAEHPYAAPGMYFRSGQVLTVTVRTKHVPNTALVKVRMNAMDPANAASVVLNAGNPVSAGTNQYDWTVNLTVPTDTEIGSIEAWVDSVCTPGTTGCAAVNP